MNTQSIVKAFVITGVLFFAIVLNSQDYLQNWDSADNDTNPLVPGGSMFGSDITDRRVKNKELILTLSNDPSAFFIAGYFQDFSFGDCSGVQDFTGKSLSIVVHQTPVILGSESILHDPPDTSHFAFEIAFDTDQDGSFSSGDAIYRTHLGNSPFVLPDQSGTTFTVDLDPANFPIRTTPGFGAFDLTQVSRIGFVLLQKVPEEGLGGSDSPTFPSSEFGYAWKFDNFSVCETDDVLFHDDFEGTSFDKCIWNVGTNTIGRTQFGQEPEINDGLASLRFDTYNPGDSGNTFSGTEIKTVCNLNRGSGLEFETRLRVPDPIANGLVIAFFSFSFNDHTDRSDEIDFELLSNWINDPVDATRVLFSTFNDFDENNPLPNQQFSTDFLVNDFEPAEFNTFTVRWFPDRTEWYINHQLVLSSCEVLPDAPMSVRLNFWAPALSFTEAFDENLVPAVDVDSNETYFFEVDYVTARRIIDIPCDLDGDGDVDRDDLRIILASRNTPAMESCDPRDIDGDGMITVLDARKCVPLCSRPRCSIE